MDIKNVGLNSKIDFIDLHGINIGSNALDLFPRDIMNRYCIVPLALDEDVIHIAVSNYDTKTIDDLILIAQRKIKPYIAKKEQILSILDAIDENFTADAVLDKLNNDYNRGFYNDFNDEANLTLENSPIVKLTNTIIKQAIVRGASDIHMEPFEDTVIIRYRIDGILQEFRNISRGIYTSIAARVKILSGMDIAEKRLPQDGKIIYKIENDTYDLRVSSLPTVYAEKIVVRILRKERKLLTLASLGFNNPEDSSIDCILNNSHGIVLVTGPTGSGKSTTLYAMLNQIDKKEKNIITIEDPVEYTMFGVNQVSVNVKAGLTFAKGLRSILRQDPNVIMVGEIRDEETAQIAVRAAITGHLVISTLHTNDSATSILRLLDMGVPQYLVSGSLLMCIAQRLARKICEFCKEEYNPSSTEIETLGIDRIDKLYKGKGCIFCNYTGYKGRTVVYEIMKIDNKLRELINNKKNTEDIRNYNKKSGMIGLKVNCRDLVLKGITTYNEFLSLCSSHF